MQAVVGALTVGGEWARQARENPDGAVQLAPGEENILSDLVGQVVPSLEFDPDATLEDVAAELSGTLSPAITSLCVAFMNAWNSLAEIHDAGNTDVKSADVLRHLALDAD